MEDLTKTVKTIRNGLRKLDRHCKGRMCSDCELNSELCISTIDLQNSLETWLRRHKEDD